MEVDYSSRTVDQFLEEGGLEGIRQTTKISIVEFDSIFDKMESQIMSNWMTGRVRCTTYKAKEVLCMTITTLTHAGNWEFLSKMFGIKSPRSKDWSCILYLFCRTECATSFCRITKGVIPWKLSGRVIKTSNTTSTGFTKSTSLSSSRTDRVVTTASRRSNFPSIKDVWLKGGGVGSPEWPSNRLHTSLQRSRRIHRNNATKQSIFIIAH